jgi:hypothetical protein
MKNTNDKPNEQYEKHFTELYIKLYMDCLKYKEYKKYENVDCNKLKFLFDKYYK